MVNGADMKEVGIITLLSVAAVAAAPTPTRSEPAQYFVTTKSTDDFGRCFVNTQERHSSPWWFVPKENGGGTFSNLGAQPLQGAYFVEVADVGHRREIRLLNGASQDRVARAVAQCI